jgi:hypothetical protein
LPRINLPYHESDHVLKEAILDADGTIVETTGQCKKGIDIKSLVRVTAAGAGTVGREASRGEVPLVADGLCHVPPGTDQRAGTDHPDRPPKTPLKPVSGCTGPAAALNPESKSRYDAAQQSNITPPANTGWSILRPSKSTENPQIATGSSLV